MPIQGPRYPASDVCAIMRILVGEWRLAEENDDDADDDDELKKSEGDPDDDFPSAWLRVHHIRWNMPSPRSRSLHDDAAGVEGRGVLGAGGSKL